jgi:hypothetical protein
VIVQRRCLRAARDIRPGKTITREMIAVLRPATPGAIGKELRWTDLGEQG